ncbi:probable protein phosphatase 2C 4 [Zingiber officinale]|uniref:probable protein phosphatase 2C 4 n=1 Tax=Zingiber officinale TaxID=94328 RepID=UPI001C4BAE12|nr:probable protein phosphatase 2C 4 [Zingiber officinale]
MGNCCARLTCFSCCCGRPPCGGRRRLRHVADTSDFYDEYFGHSFCYVRPDSACGGGGGGGGFSSSAAVAPAAASSKVHHSEETTTFRTISGASLSANPSTQLSTAALLVDPAGECGAPASAAFESSTSFSAFALQPFPRFSGPLSGPIAGAADRGFMSGPIERGFMSGPLDHRAALFSGPVENPPSIPAQLRRSISHSFSRPRRLAAATSLLRGLTKAISRTISSTVPAERSIKPPKVPALVAEGVPIPRPDSPDSPAGNLEWAQGKAGEDRIHVVVSEEHGWLFVGIYDGFNGPDATDYLLSNLYFAVHRELKGLLWDDQEGTLSHLLSKPLGAVPVYPAEFGCCRAGEQSDTCEWQREHYNSDPEGRRKDREVNHSQVLKALSRALKKTEEDYLDVADKMITENPELALMGSCVLVMLLKGEDVYLMNVGDSRAILAQKSDSDFWTAISPAKPKLDLRKINEDIASDVEVFYGCPNLSATQLTVEHSTCIEEEVHRIKNEHPDDSSAIANDRVKGSLKVTRAFGSGFLKQPKWNNALLEMFRVDYVGSSPYITCNPFLCHHKLGPKDKFLILSSDGLYQYFTNEEAVAQLEMFIATTPEGDPAQHLVEEVLFRAAKKAGMDFHELLEIPQGDRRQYHDDISIIVISLEGQIWRSCA